MPKFELFRNDEKDCLEAGYCIPFPPQIGKVTVIAHNNAIIPIIFSPASEIKYGNLGLRKFSIFIKYF